MDCIFCKIISGEIPSKKVYEDESVYAFYDINPMAPVHVLIVPKTHIASINELTPENSAVVAHIYEVAAKLAAEHEEFKDGFRVVTNCGESAGQSVFHFHIHLIPRYKGDNAILPWKTGEQDTEKLQAALEKIKAAL